MAASVYTVTTTQVPGVPFQVSRDEYDYLVELGILDELIGVTAPADKVVISTSPPPAVHSLPVGTVWFYKF